MSKPDHAERLARNAESRARAEHDREPWTSDEVDFLLDEFAKAKGDPDEEAVVAECLGRTIEACRQEYYMTMRGRTRIFNTKTVTTTVSTEYIGINDDPDDQWWSPDYYK